MDFHIDPVDSVMSGSVTHNRDAITVRKRVTTSFLKSIPPSVHEFNAYLYAVVKRKPHTIATGKFGVDVRIDPCHFNWDTGTITAIIPRNINHGITSIDDLADDWFDCLQSAFLVLMHQCLN